MTNAARSKETGTAVNGRILPMPIPRNNPVRANTMPWVPSGTRLSQSPRIKLSRIVA